MTALAIMLGGSCIPVENGDAPASLRIENGTEDDVVVLRSRPGSDLAQTLEQGLPVPPIAPGQTRTRALSTQNDAGEWCATGDLWILDPGRAVDESTRSDELNTDQVTVIEMFDGDACFGTDASAYYLVE